MAVSQACLACEGLLQKLALWHWREGKTPHCCNQALHLEQSERYRADSKHILTSRCDSIAERIPDTLLDFNWQCADFIFSMVICGSSCSVLTAQRLPMQCRTSRCANQTLGAILFVLPDAPTQAQTHFPLHDVTNARTARQTARENRKSLAKGLGIIGRHWPLSCCFLLAFIS